MEINVGAKIKSLRQKKGMKIAELAENAELSSSLISQIERNMVTPSIVSLWKIAQSLNVSVGYFFDEENKNSFNPIVTRDNRKKILASNSNATYELLSPDLNRKIEFLYITIKKGEYSTKELITHEGEECGIVIKGKLMIKMEDEEYILEEGDSIYFNSTTPHRYINVGDETCISIWAMTPPSF
ncbi:cupin domain-containing protein [Tissierella sp. MSJ-40]|uniref:Cupin domain-containing protein n=1 Tax=Tissierella simiarum TaxID=2841534 RepID=A0ABS6E166_9FIRM|nr:cupin domain-containing protein [Tissierella simiarum]MBU5436637.1 cupin domain-containing protein [Tissierella simiarum]